MWVKHNRPGGMCRAHQRVRDEPTILAEMCNQSCSRIVCTRRGQFRSRFDLDFIRDTTQRIITMDLAAINLCVCVCVNRCFLFCSYARCIMWMHVKIQKGCYQKKHYGQSVMSAKPSFYPSSQGCQPTNALYAAVYCPAVDPGSKIWPEQPSFRKTH